jgi:class 3 adenylate cyclase
LTLEARFCSACGAPAPSTAAQPHEQRKTVTAVFCDLLGSTALGESTDPEAMRGLLARYFERMKLIVERHGGSVEKFIGDAVMAVFGVPAVHEDDALRACRAALEMRDALPELGLTGRIGVNTGEVVTGTAERLATGDPINVAARLEQAAAGGEILVGEATRRAAYGLLELGERRELALKGKADPVAAHPLLAVAGDLASARRLDRPIVGRQRERQLLEQSWERVQSEQACQLFTVLGSAGVGKSRLALEFLRTLNGTRVLSGRCFSYGEGITYSPVVEMLAQAERRPSDPRAADALAALLGESEVPVAADEIAWAFRRLLEELAPVICVFDDLHWAETTLLDLVDHVTDLSRDAPILLLCLARPELLDRRPSWAGGKLNATTVLLDSLSDDETNALIDELIGGAEIDTGLRARIRAAAQGNPLFVEEMLAMAAEASSAGEEILVPPTIQALLSARLDQLERADRDVLERGAVEGQVFHLGGVAALEPGTSSATELSRRLMTLVRKDLLRPGQSEFAGEEAFRFRHILIRDAAYDGLPKATRAELHERFVDWLELRADDLAEFDEVSGYHLEQAHRYRTELGMDDERTHELGRRAAARLATAGDRAFTRRDLLVAVNLLTRALALAPADPIDVRHELRRIDAMSDAGQTEEASRLLADLVERVAAIGDGRSDIPPRVFALFFRIQAGEPVTDELESLCRAAVDELDSQTDAEPLAYAWLGLVITNLMRCQWGAVAEAAECSEDCARRCGDDYLAWHVAFNGVGVYTLGPKPAAQGRTWFASKPPQAQRSPTMTGGMAILDAMSGRVELARAGLAEARSHLLELGNVREAAGVAMWEAEVELMADEPARAARTARETCAELDAIGDLAHQSTVAGLGAEAYWRLGDVAQAREMVELARRTGAQEDVITQIYVARVGGKLLADAGDRVEGEREVRRGLALADATDMLNEQAEGRVDLAHVLSASGPASAAHATLEQAHALFSQKGNRVRAEWVAHQLATPVT